MGIIKEYRIVMPITVDEYRTAQIYMTARTQAMEAEQVSQEPRAARRVLRKYLEATNAQQAPVRDSFPCCSLRVLSRAGERGRRGDPREQASQTPGYGRRRLHAKALSHRPPIPGMAQGDCAQGVQDFSSMSCMFGAF